MFIKSREKWFPLAKGRAGLAELVSGLAAACLAIVFVCWLPAYAADSMDSSLAQLELKLFQHNYSKDGIAARLDRLEKMVYGEAKSGSPEERVKNLLSAVPNTQEKDVNHQDKQAAGTNAASKRTKAGQDEDQATPADSSKYPAVTAIELKLFGKDYASEPVPGRLDRLETKVFGRPSGIDDLSERVDRIKQRTGIDIAKQAPPGADWADDDDDSAPLAGGGEDGRGFNGRDLRRDFGVPSQNMNQKAEIPDEDMMPPAVPNYGSPAGKGQQMGLNQQVTALEQEIFGKSYLRDPLPARLNRLEATVFPQQKPAADRALPDRVARLLAVVPLSVPASRTIAQRSSRNRQDPDFADFDDLSSMQPGAQGQTRAGGGLSKIINSLGNFFTGGSYPVSPNGFITDPQTGLWLDPRTGSLVDPMTGAVVGQRMITPGAGIGMNSFGSFSNGFSPFGSAPYGTGFGTGMRFGFGGIGRYGAGIWP